MRLFHIAERAAWLAATEEYVPPSLAAEGFVHCSTYEQVGRTARRFFAGQTDLVLLEIETRRLELPVRFETVGVARFPHVYGAIPRHAVVSARPFGEPFAPPPLPDAAIDVCDALALEPLPNEGGHYRETWRTAHGTAILYLLAEDSVSALHRLHADEVYHAYAGAPVDLLMLHEDGHAEQVVLGRDLAAGELPQIVVPRATWQGLRLRRGGRWALLGTTMAPPFTIAGFELGEREALTRRWPAWAAEIRALSR